MRSPITRLLPLIWLDSPWIILQNLVLMMEIQLRVLMLLIWALECGIVLPLGLLATYITLCWLNILLLWILRIRHILKVFGWSKMLLRKIPSVVCWNGRNISIVVLVEIVVRQVLARQDLVIQSSELWLLVPRLLVLISSRLKILSSKIRMSLTCEVVGLASWLFLSIGESRNVVWV